MKNTSYYGSENNNKISYLEFGSIDTKNANKQVWGFWLDQQAYDLYMFSRYARDLFVFRDYIQDNNKSLSKFKACITSTAHDKLMDYIAKYAGVLAIKTIANNEQQSIVEVGSSLFGMIDEMLAIDATIADGKNLSYIEKIEYIGCDISELMNRGAKELHPTYKMKLYTDENVKKFLDSIKSLDVDMFYGLSVSLRYALRESDDLINIGKKSKIAVFNRISFSYDKTLEMDMGTGKSVYIISLSEYIEGLKKSNIKARYYTGSIQKDRDGVGTIRATVIMAEDEALLEQYIKEHDKCIETFNDEVEQEIGRWKEIRELFNE